MIRKNQISQFFIILIVLIISCNSQDRKSQETEEAKILSLFIDEMAVPFPLPPMPSEGNLQKSIRETNWDSIKKTATTFAILKIFRSQL